MWLYPPLTCADTSFSSLGILLLYVVDSPRALPRTVGTPQILSRKCREDWRGGTGRCAAGGAVKGTLSDYPRAGRNPGAEWIGVRRKFRRKSTSFL